MKPPGQKATNGSVMRCTPLAIVYADDHDELQRVSRESSRVTHIDPHCVHGCAVLNVTTASILRGDEMPLTAALEALPDDASVELVDRLEPIPDAINPEMLEPANDVIETLRTTLYYALTADDLETAIVDAVNRGGDADTMGAITGAVAGARFGASDVPDRWISGLQHRVELTQLADKLVTLS